MVKIWLNLLIVNYIDFPFKFLWKVKVPPKINVFLRLVEHNNVLTKDDLMIIRGWIGNSKCAFCFINETVDHPFIHCSVAKFM